MPYVRAITTGDHPTLRKVAKKVQPKEIADPLFQQLIDDMFETMYAAPGVGLAAPQVNVAKRLFVMDVGEDEQHPTGSKYVVINPKIDSAQDEVEMSEGCLSVPGYVGELMRFQKIAVVGLDRFGGKIRVEGEGLLAQCLQHELDHLNGVLYSDKARDVRLGKAQEERELAQAAAAPQH